MKILRLTVNILTIFIVLVSCNDDDLIVEPNCQYSTPESITRLIEIIDFKTIDRTSELKDCKETSLFRFNLAVSKMLISNHPCNSEIQHSYGSANRGVLDSTGIELLKIEFANPYTLHDSMTLGNPDIEMPQFYELVRIDEEVLIFQTHNELSVPKTKNTWQLTISF